MWTVKSAYRNALVPSKNGKSYRGDGVKREIIPKEAAVVQRTFEMYAAGLGYRTIARKLNIEGVPAPGCAITAGRSRWHAAVIHSLLKNTKYVGINTWSQTKVVRNPLTQRIEQHPRPESEWERVTGTSSTGIAQQLQNAQP
jgi:hypothetical protein